MRERGTYVTLSVFIFGFRFNKIEVSSSQLPFFDPIFLRISRREIENYCSMNINITVDIT